MVDQTPFEFMETVDGNTTVVTGAKISGRPECFMIKFQRAKSRQLYAILSSISGIDRCNPCAPVATRQVVQATIQYAKERGAKWVELADETKICDGVSLADYYFLSRGKTWYETIASFLPEQKDTVDDFRAQIHHNTWGYVMDNFKRKYPKKYREFKKEYPINVAQPTPAMSVIAGFPAEQRCNMLQKYVGYLLAANDINSLRGYVWYLPLADDYERNAPNAPVWNVAVTREE
jgi:hypothetical protein